MGERSSELAKKITPEIWANTLWKIINENQQQTMCGIAGILQLSNFAIDKNKIIAMNNALAHRGPDDEGYFHDELISLAHKRLSIIDLSPL